MKAVTFAFPLLAPFLPAIFYSTQRFLARGFRRERQARAEKGKGANLEMLAAEVKGRVKETLVYRLALIVHC